MRPATSDSAVRNGAASAANTRPGGSRSARCAERGEVSARSASRLARAACTGCRRTWPPRPSSACSRLLPDRMTSGRSGDSLRCDQRLRHARARVERCGVGEMCASHRGVALRQEGPVRALRGPVVQALGDLRGIGAELCRTHVDDAAGRVVTRRRATSARRIGADASSAARQLQCHRVDAGRQIPEGSHARTLRRSSEALEQRRGRPPFAERAVELGDPA